jgi:hypothetical protein
MDDIPAAVSGRAAGRESLPARITVGIVLDASWFKG